MSKYILLLIVGLMCYGSAKIGLWLFGEGFGALVFGGLLGTFGLAWLLTHVKDE